MNFKQKFSKLFLQWISFLNSQYLGDIYYGETPKSMKSQICNIVYYTMYILHINIQKKAACFNCTQMKGMHKLARLHFTCCTRGACLGCLVFLSAKGHCGLVGSAIVCRLDKNLKSFVPGKFPSSLKPSQVVNFQNLVLKRVCFSRKYRKCGCAV